MIDPFDEAQEEILYPTVEDEDGLDEWEVIFSTDPTLDMLPLDDPRDFDDIGAMYDDDPNPYLGTYSEE